MQGPLNVRLMALTWWGDVPYIIDYTTDACNGSNPDFEEPLNAEWYFKEL